MPKAFLIRKHLRMHHGKPADTGIVTPPPSPEQEQQGPAGPDKKPAREEPTETHYGKLSFILYVLRELV